MKSRTFVTILMLSGLLLEGCASPSGPKKLSKSEKIEGLMGIAAAAISDDNPISALNALNEVHELDDSIPEEHYLYALAYLKKNEIALAEESARKAVELNPKFSAAKNALGKILLDQGKYHESERLLKEAASDLLYREAHLSKLNLGILYYKKMNLSESEKWLNASLRDQTPFSCLSHFYLGKIALENQLLAKAEREFVFATKGSCAALRDAHIAVGQTMVQQKKFDVARAKFIEIQRLFPESDTADIAARYLRDLP